MRELGQRLELPGKSFRARLVLQPLHCEALGLFRIGTSHGEDVSLATLAKALQLRGLQETAWTAWDLGKLQKPVKRLLQIAGPRRSAGGWAGARRPLRS